MDSFFTTTNEVINHFIENDNLYTLFFNTNQHSSLLSPRDGSKKASLSLVIYSCVKPIFKIYLIIGTGYLLSKLNILNGQAIKIISQIVLSVLLPSLSFNKIVANIQDSLIKEVGICVLSSVILFALGGSCGIAANIICKIPKGWRYGSICACIFPNISDLPIAYLQNMQSVFTEEQINQGVSFVIIFLVAFLLAVFNLGGFKLVEYDFIAQNKLIEESKTSDLEQGENTHSSIEMNKYDHSDNSSSKEKNGKQSTPEQPSEIQSLDTVGSHEVDIDSVSDYDDYPSHTSKTRKPSVLSSTKPKIYREDSNNLQHKKSRRMSILSNQESLQNQILNLSKQKSLVQDFAQTDKEGNPIPDNPVLRFIKYNSKKLDLDNTMNEDLQRWASYHSSKPGSEVINELTHENYPNSNGSFIDDHASNILSSLNLETEETTGSRIARMVTTDTQITSKDIDNAGKGIVSDRIRNIRGMKFLIFFIENCMRPCPMSVILALIVAFIPWVRALFVASNVKMANAPDNLPPLSFIMDYTSYVGAASVPFGLLLLGATLGNLDIKTLPKGFVTAAMFMLVARQVFMPVIGILWCNRLAQSGWVDMTTDLTKVLMFVICIDFGLPSMTTMIYLTSGFTPIDADDTLQMDCVSFFLMIQYPLLIINLPFMASYYLKVQLQL